MQLVAVPYSILPAVLDGGLFHLGMLGRGDVIRDSIVILLPFTCPKVMLRILQPVG